MTPALQWELDWVMKNADLYTGGATYANRLQCRQLARAVCGNITKRYRIAELEKELKLKNSNG